MNQTETKISIPAGFHLQETRDTLTGKPMSTYRHVSGFRLKVLPMPGFSRSFAALTVPYGSVHTRFTSEKQACEVPAGTAHFLEHCIFSRDDEGGLLGRLSAMGANANAYTTHDHTLYYFSTVDQFEEALLLYVDTVLQPYLEQDRVDTEKPVILAELNQYLDDPDTRCYMQLMENLYEYHPVRLDIGGTADTVGLIQSEHLKQVWQAFYQPGMLSLTLAGDLDEQAILLALASRLPGKARVRPVIRWPAEPARPLRQQQQLSMDVAAPSFLIGVKDPFVLPGHLIDGLTLVNRQRTAALLLETLLSPVSPIHEVLYNEGLINDSFGFHYACENSFAYLAAGGESAEPQKAAERLIALLTAALDQPVDPELFEIQKRAAAGDFVRSLDSVEHSGMTQAQCNLHDMDLFDYPALYDKMNAVSAAEMMGFLSDRRQYSIAVVQKDGGNESYDK